MKNKYQTLVNDTIPISKGIGWHIDRLTPFEICAKVDLAPNINIHGTAFAGSIYAAAMATGWTLLKGWYEAHHFEAELVAAEANIKYFAPVSSDFYCLGKIDKQSDAYQKLVSRLSQPKSCGFEQIIEINCKDKLCAILTINFVFKC